MPYKEHKSKRGKNTKIQRNELREDVKKRTQALLSILIGLHRAIFMHAPAVEFDTRENWKL